MFNFGRKPKRVDIRADLYYPMGLGLHAARFPLDEARHDDIRIWSGVEMSSADLERIR